jgi:hypothetical protein
MGKRGPACTICSSPHRAQIDIGLVHGLSAKALAAKFNVGDDAILRHSQNHLTAAQRAEVLTAQHPTDIDLDALRTAESESLIANVTTQRARLTTLGELALELQDVRAAVSVEAAITSNLTLAAKLLGQLVSVVDHRHSNVLLSEDYIKLRECLVRALQPYPEALQAVARALATLETETAATITARAAPKPPPPPPMPILVAPPPPPPKCH